MKFKIKVERASFLQPSLNECESVNQSENKSESGNELVTVRAGTNYCFAFKV